ncbi:MAG TPA: hypothetical protein VGQ83_16520 [Polyangia bacterium]|jgi:hypothetical protein
MARVRVLVALAAAAALATACTKEAAKPAPAVPAPAGPRTAAPAGPKAAAPVAAAAAKPATAGCELPAPVTGNVTINQGCVVTVKEEVDVKEGAVLTIQPGAKLSFTPDGYLYVDHGQLVARGTTEAPIVFTSANPTGGAGDWIGLVFEEKTMAGTVLDHVVVEFAGKTGSYGHGGITVKGAGAPRRITITNSTIRKNEQAGLTNLTDQGTFAKLAGNTFSANGTSLRIQANLLGSVGPNTFGDPVHVEGNVTATQTWPKLDVPLLVDANLTVGGDKAAAILTLPEKATLKFAPDTYLWIGAESGGAVVAKGVTFTSANASATPGDWVGVVIEEKSNGTVLDGCTIELAGKEGGYGKGALTFRGVKPGPGVKLTATTFRKNKQAAIATDEGDCGDLAKPAAANKSEGAPLCRKPE